MIEEGTRVRMTKGYRDIGGVITERTDSIYELYLVELDNGINIVVGPSAFVNIPDTD